MPDLLDSLLDRHEGAAAPDPLDAMLDRYEGGNLSAATAPAPANLIEDIPLDTPSPVNLIEDVAPSYDGWPTPYPAPPTEPDYAPQAWQQAAINEVRATFGNYKSGVGMNQPEINAIFEKHRRAADPTADQRYLDASYGSLSGGQKLLESGVSAMKGFHGGATSLLGSVAPETANDINQWLAQNTAGSADVWQNSVSEGAGGAAPYLLASRMKAPVATGIGLGGAQGVGGTRAEVAQMREADPNREIGGVDEAKAAAAIGALNAATGGAFMKLMPGVGQWVKGLANPILRGGAAVGLDAAANAPINVGQQLATNAIAGGTYDPSREATKDVRKAFWQGLGGGIPGGMGAIHHANAARAADANAAAHNADPARGQPPTPDEIARVSAWAQQMEAPDATRPQAGRPGVPVQRGQEPVAQPRDLAPPENPAAAGGRQVADEAGVLAGGAGDAAPVRGGAGEAGGVRTQGAQAAAPPQQRERVPVFEYDVTITENGQARRMKRVLYDDLTEELVSADDALPDAPNPFQQEPPRDAQPQPPARVAADPQARPPVEQRAAQGPLAEGNAAGPRPDRAGGEVGVSAGSMPVIEPGTQTLANGRTPNAQPTPSRRPVKLTKPRPFTRKDVEDRLLQSFNEYNGEGASGTTRNAEVRQDSGTDLQGVGKFTFFRQLPTEVKQFMQGRPEMRRVFRVSQNTREAQGADAMHAMGENYWKMAEEIATGKDSRVAAAVKFAKGNPDPQMQILAAIHENMPPAKQRGPIQSVNPAELPPGTKFKLWGSEFEIVEKFDADGESIRLLKDGDEYPLVPAEGVREMPADKGSVKKGSWDDPEQSGGFLDGIEDDPTPPRPKFFDPEAEGIKSSANTGIFGQDVIAPQGKRQGGLFHEPVEVKGAGDADPRDARARKINENDPNQGEFVPADPAGNPDDVAGMYAGEKGAARQGTERVQARRTANEMITAGVDPEKVRLATGWFKNPYDGKWRYEIDDSGMKILKSSGDLALGTPGVLGTGFANRWWRLGEVIDHPKLFEAYPHLKKVAVVGKPGTRGGLYSDKFDGIIHVDPIQPGWEKTLLHEIQHAVQQHEGFARGSPFKGAARAVEDLPADDYRAFYDDPTAYRMSAGEIEARDVEARAGMTAEQRAGGQAEKANALFAEAEQVRKSVEYRREERRYEKAGFTPEALAERNAAPAHRRVHEIQDQIKGLGFDLNRRDVREQFLAGGVKDAKPYGSENIPPEQAVVKMDVAAAASDTSGVSGRREPWQMTRREFRGKFYQHNVFRPDAPEVGPEGFKSGIGPNVVLATDGPPASIMDKRYGTREGRPIYIVPKEWVRDTPNGPKIKDGWKPGPNDKLVPDYDYQPVHEMIVKRAIENGEPVPASVLRDYPNLQKLVDERGVAESRPDDVTAAPSPAHAAPKTMAAGAGPQVKSRDIIAQVEKLTGTPVRTGHGMFAQRKAAGWYRRQADVIRNQQAEDLATAYHEAGHALHAKVVGWSLPWPAGVAKELQAMGRELYGNRQPNGGYRREGLAEYVARDMLADPDLAKVAPKTKAWFEADVLGKHPELAKEYAKLKEMARQWDEQGAVARIKAKIHTEPRGPLASITNAYEALTSLFSRRRWVNASAPLEDAQARLVKERGINEADIPIVMNPAKVMQALKGSAPGTARFMVEEGMVNNRYEVVGPSLRDALLPVKDDADFTAYAYARVAEMLHDRGIDPGISREDAAYGVRDLETPERRAASDAITRWADGLLEYHVEAGGLSRDAADLIRKMNPVYIPLLRYFGESAHGNKGGGSGRRGVVNQGQGVHRRTGSRRTIRDPLESLVLQAEALVSRANKARAGRAIADFTDAVGGRAGWFAEKVDLDPTGHQFKVEDVRRQLEALGADLSAVDMDRMLMVFDQPTAYRGPDNIVTIWRDGKREFWELDPEVYKAVTEMDVIELGEAMKLLSANARLIRAGATAYNGAFALANMIKDTLTAPVFGRRWTKLPVVDSVRGLVSQIANLPEAQRYHAAGVGMATLMGQDRAKAGRFARQMLADSIKEKAVQKIVHPLDTLRSMLEVGESAARVEEFRQTLEDAEAKWGKGTESAVIDAMVAAKEVTVDFTRGGTIAVGLNRLSPFFNARIQGASRLWRALSNPKTATAATLKAFSMITVGSLLLYWSHKDEEWWKELPDHERFNYWHWSMDGGKTIHRIPMPESLGKLFGALPVEAFHQAIQKGDHRANDALFDLVKSFLPISSPADLAMGWGKPAVEAYSNHDSLRNRSIVPVQIERGKMPKDQYARHTTDLAKYLGEKFNVSPMKVEHMISGYTGGAGLNAMRWADIWRGTRKDRGEKADTFLIGRFYSRDPIGRGKQVEQFYDRLEELRQRKGSKALKGGEMGELMRMEKRARVIAQVRDQADAKVITDEQARRRIQDLTAKTP
ncbi:MAG TPA: LPD38 domain-containing protein [Tepidisphaeraceae bacterium]|nr:LPD38 domain-containing protein [Tepidisphaeraceae bacterium]